MLTSHLEVKESLVVCQNNQGLELRATLLRMTRFAVVFESYNIDGVLRVSEVLNEFRIIVQDRTLYAGRAVVRNLLNAGPALVCEVSLEEGSWMDVDFTPTVSGKVKLRNDFAVFLGEWQKVYKVKADYKVVVADMQTFLADLRLWLEQVELSVRSLPTGNRIEIEQEAVREIGEAVVPAFDAMHERLEALSNDIEEPLRPVHQNFSKRQLHPLVLCSPFAYRTYSKPLGYAGDYEMVNMIMRDPHEGSSLFAKVVNLWFLSQWPARAHRNRIEYLTNCLRTESLRAARRGTPLRILNLGCGPALEIQQFLTNEKLSEQAQFTLLDFNEETIQHTSRRLEELKKRYGRATSIQILKKSVHQVLKEGAKPVAQSPDKQYDLIYCAGLFDYLADKTCKQLMNVFFDRLAPGGLISATNVDSCKPFRHMLEFILDWHLIYRDSNRCAALIPERASEDMLKITRDPTTVNLFLEVRKPDHA